MDERWKRYLDVAASARIKNDELLSDRLCRCLEIATWAILPILLTMFEWRHMADHLEKYSL